MMYDCLVGGGGHTSIVQGEVRGGDLREELTEEPKTCFLLGLLAGTPLCVDMKMYPLTCVEEVLPISIMDAF